MNFCKNCGAQNDPGVRFCQKCGSPMAPTAPTAPTAPMGSYTTAPYAPAPAAVPGKGQGIAGMILGIIAVVFFCLWYIAIPCGIAGIILSSIGNSKANEAGATNGPAKAGIICSAISLGLAVFFLILIAAGIASL